MFDQLLNRNLVTRHLRIIADYISDIVNICKTKYFLCEYEHLEFGLKFNNQDIVSYFNRTFFKYASTIPVLKQDSTKPANPISSSRVTIEWMKYLVLKLESYLLGQNEGSVSHIASTSDSCEYKFNHIAFISGMVITSTVLASLYTIYLLRKRSNPTIQTRSITSTYNIYVEWKTNKTIPPSNMETTLTTIEEENIYQDIHPNTNVNVGSCQSSAFRRYTL